jgi:hypothetical protein
VDCFAKNGNFKTEAWSLPAPVKIIVCPEGREGWVDNCSFKTLDIGILITKADNVKI